MELPEAKLIKSEIVLREMQLTEEVKMARKALVRWVALSLGVISPKESRQSILLLLEALLFYHIKEKKEPNYEDLLTYFQTQGATLHEKTTRYHLTQLRKAGVLENSRGTYKFVGFQGENLAEALESTYRRRSGEAFLNIRTAIEALKKLQE